MATKKRATHPASDATSWQCIRCDIPLHDPSFGQHAAHIAIGVNFLILTFTAATASLWSPIFSALARLLAYPTLPAGGLLVFLLLKASAVSKNQTILLFACIYCN
jgi:hypothetical protein